MGRGNGAARSPQGIPSAILELYMGTQISCTKSSDLTNWKAPVLVPRTPWVGKKRIHGRETLLDKLSGLRSEKLG